MPDGWNMGSIKGIVTRTQAKINVIWNKIKVVFKLTSFKDQTVKISCKGVNSRNLSLKKGKNEKVDFEL